MRRAPSPSRAADLEGSPSRSLSQPEEPSPPAGGRDPPSSLSLSDDIQMGDGANSFCSCWREGAHDMALAPTDTASCSGRNSQARTHAHVHRSNARKDVRFDRIQEHQRRVHVFVYAHVHVHMHVLSMCLCMHTCACVCVWPHHTCACVCVRQPPPPHTCMTAPHVCICMCVCYVFMRCLSAERHRCKDCMYACMHVFMYVCVCIVCMYLCAV
jgi:hypothetical protein